MGYYFVKEDEKVIEDWAKDKNLKVSFREAGADTIKCLERGAGAKPHAILDKTIKGDSEAVKDFFKHFGKERGKAEDLLKGLVGHWTKEKAIDGLYLTGVGQQEWAKGHLDMIKQSKEGNSYLELSGNNHMETLMAYYDALVKNKGAQAEYYFCRCFYSGDYDMHDLYQSNAPVPSKIDMQLIKDVQEKLLKDRQKQLIKAYGLKDEDFQGEENADYYRIQHGPQCNYIAQMINENVKAKNMSQINALVDVVCRPSLPVNMFFANKEQAGKKGMWKEIVSHQLLLEEIRNMGNTVTQTKAMGITKEELQAIDEQIEAYKVSTVRHAIELIATLNNKNVIAVTFKELKKECPKLVDKYKDKLEEYFNKAVEKLAK